MTALAIGFVTTKAPRGGYSLSRITSLENSVASEVIAHRSTLAEIQMIEHQEKSEVFGETAWYMPPHPQPYAPPPQQPFMPASAVMPQPEHDSGDMPRFMDRNGTNGGGLMQSLQRDMDQVARLFIPALFIASLWVAANLRPLLA